MTANDLSYRSFPINALPQPIRGFVDSGARAIGCDQSYLALPLLVALAAAIGNTRRLELKRNWPVPAILWGAIIGESGTAKTPAFGLVLRPVHERQQKALARHEKERKKYDVDLACWENDMQAWKKRRAGAPPMKPDSPEAERSVVNDTTVEALIPILRANPRGLLLARDELSGWFGSFDRYVGRGRASTDSANWLSMFNGKGVIVDRRTGTSQTIHVPRAAVSICGGIQPAILQRALANEHRESGLAARFLLAYPPSQAKVWTETDVDPNAESDVDQLFDRLYELKPVVGSDGAPQPALVTLTQDAKRVWETYYNDHAAEQANLTGDLAAAWSKLEEYAARLALVIHFVRWAADPERSKPDSVDTVSMSAGICLAKWFKHEARRVYAMLDESNPERDLRRLLEMIDRNGKAVTSREVQQKCRWLKSRGSAEAALETLVKAELGTWQSIPTTGRGGRPSRVFVLSTPSTARETRAKTEGNEGCVDVDSVDALG